MSHARTKLIFAGLAILAAVSLLAFAGMREGWVYYLPVDDFTSNSDYQQSRVRLHGTVAAEGLELHEALLTARFELCGETSSVAVNYTGVVPDMFEPGCDVVVEGELDENGVFQANTLMTKCASKYESGEGQAPHADPRGPESTE
jgi:cytochrome c-type biogenesis protein CcmE